jgi:hypothetical protein
MTIKQQGGIFGRNPTFNNVTVDGTLTVDQIAEKTGAAGITLDGVTLKDGNVVLANGKGIDFSATPGTGTSELFNDYEEGTWTPEYTTSNGDYASVTYVFQLGSYRKVGSLVFITLSMRTSAVNKTGATGLLQIKNLPFTAATQTQGAASLPTSYATLFNNVRPMGAYVISGGTTMSLTFISNPTGGNWGELAAGELATTNPSNILVLSGCYIAA